MTITSTFNQLANILNASGTNSFEIALSEISKTHQIRSYSAESFSELQPVYELAEQLQELAETMMTADREGVLVAFNELRAIHEHAHLNAVSASALETVLSPLYALSDARAHELNNMPTEVASEELISEPAEIIEEEPTEGYAVSCAETLNGLYHTMQNGDAEGLIWAFNELRSIHQQAHLNGVSADTLAEVLTPLYELADSRALDLGLIA